METISIPVIPALFAFFMCFGVIHVITHDEMKYGGGWLVPLALVCGAIMYFVVVGLFAACGYA